MGLLSSSGVRGWIYDKLIVGLTAGFYKLVLTDLPNKAKLLDVGVGTATALARNASLVKDKEITVEGIDIDKDYVQAAQNVLTKHELHDNVTVKVGDALVHNGGPYNAIYFSCSFMIIPNKVQMLKRLCTLLTDKQDGRVYWTQTFHYHSRGPIAWLNRKLKPLLKYLLTIDFGEITYEKDFRETLAAAGIIIEDFKLTNWGILSGCYYVKGRVKGE